MTLQKEKMREEIRAQLEEEKCARNSRKSYAQKWECHKKIVIP